MKSNPTQIMAHRGASAVERENTTVAFRRAAEMGAHAVELDVRICNSGELVVHHNAVLADSIALKDLSRDQLPAYIPNLTQALDACSGMWVNIEIKNDEREPDFDSSDKVAEMVVDLLRRRNPTQRWLISSFRRETVDYVHTLWPHLPTAWLTNHVIESDAEALAESLNASGHCALNPNVRDLSRQVVSIMHRNGLAVNAWTCDDPVRIGELIDWGIDGICTNTPDVALRVLAERAGQNQ
ncbi:MAG: glycerophosphodiester phosphodiesterase [Ilumatobacteraceae bacterium]